jgi:hypothetical protein
MRQIVTAVDIPDSGELQVPAGLGITEAGLPSKRW